MAIFSSIILLALLFGSLYICCISVSFGAHALYKFAYSCFDIIFHTRITYIWEKGHIHSVQVRTSAWLQIYGLSNAQEEHKCTPNLGPSADRLQQWASIHISSMWPVTSFTHERVVWCYRLLWESNTKVIHHSHFTHGWEPLELKWYPPSVLLGIFAFICNCIFWMKDRLIVLTVLPIRHQKTFNTHLYFTHPLCSGKSPLSCCFTLVLCSAISLCYTNFFGGANTEFQRESWGPCS